MAIDKPNPLREWMQRTETSPETLSALVTEKGGQASPKYLEHIANGLMEPSWKLCEVLEKITGIDARALKSFAYRRSEKAAS